MSFLFSRIGEGGEMVELTFLAWGRKGIGGALMSFKGTGPDIVKIWCRGQRVQQHDRPPKVDKKAMIRNRYIRISHPILSMQL